MSSPTFQPTRWSLLAGAASADPAVRCAALERLCAQYWFPLYAYLRRAGRDPDLAADTVQGLFAHLLEAGSLARLEPGSGSFRSWLLTALQNFERDAWRRAQAEKRGGGRAPIPIDAQMGERRLELQGPVERDPEAAFERAWALETLGQARQMLEAELRETGQPAHLGPLVATALDDTDARSRTKLAAELGLTPVTLRVTIHRLRTRYRELLILIVADSLGERSEAGEELRALSLALAGEKS